MTQRIINQIKDLYTNKYLSCKAISKILLISEKRIAKLLKEENLIRKPGKNYKYQCNEKFFSNIDTEVKAYWLGVLFADGNISKNNCGTGQIFLTSKDKDWLETFLKDINSTGVLYKEIHKKYNKPIWKVHITSDKLYTDLCNLGCIPKKSLIIQFPNISLKLIPHFIRGYFDGDGTIGVYHYIKESNCVTLKSSICSGSEKFLEELAKYLPTKMKKLHFYSGVFQIRFSVKDTISFCNYIYNNSTRFLLRKKKIIDNYLKERRSTTIIVTPNNRMKE